MQNEACKNKEVSKLGTCIIIDHKVKASALQHISTCYVIHLIDTFNIHFKLTISFVFQDPRRF